MIGSESKTTIYLLSYIEYISIIYLPFTVVYSCAIFLQNLFFFFFLFVFLEEKGRKRKKRVEGRSPTFALLSRYGIICQTCQGDSGASVALGLMKRHEIPLRNTFTIYPAHCTPTSAHHENGLISRDVTTFSACFSVLEESTSTRFYAKKCWPRRNLVLVDDKIYQKNINIYVQCVFICAYVCVFYFTYTYIQDNLIKMI